METSPTLDEQLAAKKILIALSGSRLELDQLSEQQTLEKDLGIDSFQFVSLVLEVEKKLNRKVFSLENLPHIKTVGDLLKTLGKNPRPGAQS